MTRQDIRPHPARQSLARCRGRPSTCRRDSVPRRGRRAGIPVVAAELGDRAGVRRAVVPATPAPRRVTPRGPEGPGVRRSRTGLRPPDPAVRLLRPDVRARPHRHGPDRGRAPGPRAGARPAVPPVGPAVPPRLRRDVPPVRLPTAPVRARGRSRRSGCGDPCGAGGPGVVRILLGTAAGMLEAGPGRDPVALAGHDVGALAPAAGGGWWAVANGTELWHVTGGEERAPATAPEGVRIHCLMDGPAGVLVGATEAGLFRLVGEELAPVPSFDSTPGRDTWSTPWGGPPDVRSMAAGPAVAVAGDHVLLTASTGPRTRQATIYRRPLDSDGPFERCTDGLPEWFDANLDTHRLASDGPTVILAAPDDALYRSD